MPWQLLPNVAQVLAVHAAYMGFGKIVYFGGDEHDPIHNEKHVFDATRIFDCGSLAVLPAASPPFDAFCCGHAFVAAANIVKLLIAGGTEQFDKEATGQHHDHFPGLKDAAIFSSPDFILPSSGGWDWNSVAPMTPGALASPQQVPKPDPSLTGGRWYPTLTTLPDGDVIAFSGHPGSSDAEHSNFIPEVFARNPQPGGKWTRLAQYSNGLDREYYETHSTTYYPRMHVLPTGDILCTNPVGQSRTVTFQPDVGSHGGTFYDVCGFPKNALDAFSGYAGTSVLLPLRAADNYRARAMICGGYTVTPYLLDLANWNQSQSGKDVCSWRETGKRRIGNYRAHANSVILPTGEIFVCGGIDAELGKPTFDALGVKTPEIYNPYTDTWNVGDAASSVRNYHSVALLMPDGRVWTAGSDRDAGRGAGAPPAGNPDVRNLDIEIYEPWYFAELGRPYITAAPSLAYPGQTILVRTTYAKEIERVVLVRCGTATHSFNGDQRMIELAFSNPVADSLLVEMPPNNNILVPGPYLIFTIRQKKGTPGLPSSGTDIYIVPEKEDRRRERRHQR